ncbi:MAG TPA: hypothetical protein VES67_16885 [Vicinamibacterales bacterium]|nr:hypothetical protein [Vicinamibacterales bacterium]
MLRRLWIVLAFLLVPAVANADGHRAGIFAGGSFMRASEIVGVHTSTELVLFKSLPRLLVIPDDISIHRGQHESGRVTVTTVMWGGGWSLAPTDDTKHAPSVHLLIGGVQGMGNDADLAMAVGGVYQLVDRNVMGWEIGVQAQYDYFFFPRTDAQNFHRVSGGLVFRKKK